jgi:hypothetical protein
MLVHRQQTFDNAAQRAFTGAMTGPTSLRV